MKAEQRPAPQMYSLAMDNVVEPGCRPTLRVLREQLQEPSAWEDPEQIRAITAGNFRSVLPLSKLGHPIVSADHNLKAAEESAHNLMIYQHAASIGLPSVWRELRRDPWRGLVTQPLAKEEWWLLHAGIRRQADRSNAYEAPDSANKPKLLTFH